VQGAVAEHAAALRRVGAEVREVRTAAQLAEVDALVIPGGESTTLRRVAGDSGLVDELRGRVAGGMPVLGTCAGLIALADDIADGDPALVGGLDVTVRRNGYGRQRDSFEATVSVHGLGEGPMQGVFIRAPRITRTGPGVEVVARHGDDAVAVRSGSLMGTAFHPELTGDDRMHEWIVLRARAARAGRRDQTREEGRRVRTQ
jgi:pyridoxal 5'-phosphate synthase pdxT subunit